MDKGAELCVLLEPIRFGPIAIDDWEERQDRGRSQCGLLPTRCRSDARQLARALVAFLVRRRRAGFRVRGDDGPSALASAGHVAWSHRLPDRADQPSFVELAEKLWFRPIKVSPTEKGRSSCSLARPNLPQVLVQHRDERAKALQMLQIAMIAHPDVPARRRLR